MSEDTARAVTEARAEWVKHRQVVERLKQECLDSVAAEIPAGVETYAKKIAQEQPAVTKKLGREGVAALRADISSAAERLASEVKEARSSVLWPRDDAQRDGVATALFKFLNGPRVDRIDSVLQSRGYVVSEHSGLNPHMAFRLRRYGELNREFAVLASKAYALEAAMADDDRDTVDDLWGS